MHRGYTRRDSWLVIVRWDRPEDLLAWTAGDDHEDPLTWLAEDEHKRLAVVSHAATRNQMAAGRVLLRKTLAELYPKTTPKTWTVGRDEDGAPWVRHAGIATPPEVSMTHTQGMVAVSSSPSSACGIDVEHNQRPVSSERLVQRFFPQEEIDELSAYTAENLHDEFIIRWTIREAWAKAERTSFLDALSLCRTKRQRDHSILLYVSSDCRCTEGSLFSKEISGYHLTGFTTGDTCEDLPKIGEVAQIQ